MPQYDGSPYTQNTTPARGDLFGVMKDISEALPENQTKYAEVEDVLQFGSWASKVRAVTASGTVTLADTDPIFIEIDPNGSNRDVNFPAKSDDNHAYFIRHSGSANTLTLKRSGGATITTLVADEVKYIIPSTLEDFTALAGSAGLTVLIASVTTANVTGVEGTHHILDVSGMTANRDLNLPTPSAAGQRCKVTLSVGDATYALIVKVNSVEVTRLFITNETLEYVATGTGAANWQLAQDGRIASISLIERSTAQSISNNTATKIQLNSSVINVGDLADVATNYRINIRRTGNYQLEGVYYNLLLDDQETAIAYLYVDGVALSILDRRDVSSPTSNSYGTARITYLKNLTAGQYVELYVYHNEGASVNTDTTYRPALTVIEMGAGGGGSSGGGGALSDGDYGDVTVGGSGTTMTIDAGAVTLAKLVDATAQYKLLGRLTAAAGDFEEISGSANVFSLLQAADYAAMRTLLGLVIGTNVQAYDADLTTWAGLTPSANAQSLVTAANYAAMRTLLTLSSADSPQFTGIELGHATDTTITRSAAGVLAVEGVVLPSISSTNTLTNKRVTPRVGTVASSATPTINTDNVDLFTITALTVDITSMTTNLSGTPTDGQKLQIAITGTATRAITWGATFEASTIALPTTTSGTSRLDVGFIWNAATSKWRCVGYV